MMRSIARRATGISFVMAALTAGALGRWVEKPDLSRVDEIGFADLMPGSGHGWGGFVNVGRIDVYGTPVKR